MATEKLTDKPVDVAFADVNVGILNRVFAVYPNAQTVSIVAKGPDGEAVIPIPMARDTEDLAAIVVEVLGKLKPGEWMRAKSIAAETDRDPQSGHFLRTLSRLAKDGIVESNRNFGYRLPQGK